MKKICLILFLVIAGSAFAQERTEGAHQAEINSRQNEVDGEVGPSQNMRDSRNVSEANEESVDPDSASNETNTRGVNVTTTNPGSSPGYPLNDGRDGTNTKAEATLNIAGSPVPGSGTKSASPPAKVNSEVKKPVKAEPQAKSQDSKNRKESKKKKKR
jgi:hypothetical protein